MNMKIKEMIEKMDGELTDVIEDFMRAVDVEALGIAKKSGTCSFLNLMNIHAEWPCRTRTFAWEAQVCRGWLSPTLPLHGRNAQVSPQGNNGLGEQSTVAEGWISDEYILASWVARNRENSVSSFDLRNAP